MTVRPPTPAESALYVQLRHRPSIVIFPPEDNPKFQELIGTVGQDTNYAGGKVVVSQDIMDAGPDAVLTVIEWARLSMERYYGFEDEQG